MKKLIVSFLLSLTFVSCSTIAPTAGKNFNPESKEECIKICKEANMDLQALVVIAGMSGCVCGNKDIKNASNSSAAVGGAIADIIAQQKKKQQQGK